jgi:hypothetical protein
MSEVFRIYIEYLGYFVDTSWIWMPFILAVIFFQSWMYYIQRFYWRNLEWIILEVKPPSDTEKTPKNMEQIFAGLWGAFGTIANKYQKYIKGVMQDYFSFEIVGINGEVHFYLRTLRKYRNVVEAQIYSQYPQAEIKEIAEDYIHRIPSDVPNKNWDLWGCKLKLNNGNSYPIRTYSYFLDQAKSDEPFLDPVASLMEFLGKLKEGEQIWIQLLFRPVGDDWRWEAISMANALIGKRPTPAAEGVVKQDIRTWGEALREVFYEFVLDKKAPPTAQQTAQEAPPSLAQFLSPGEKDVVMGIEEKAAKKGFTCKLQWAYIAKRNVFSPGAISAIMGIFNQFANLNMNTFVPDAPSMTKASYAFAKLRKAFRQRKLLRLLRSRSFWERGYILNIEELASVYHFPTIAVKAPVTPYIEVKKGGPPIDLPLE